MLLFIISFVNIIVIYNNFILSYLDCKSSSIGPHVRYVATSGSRPMPKMQMNNYKEPASVKVTVDGTHTAVRRPTSHMGLTNGEPMKKTLREMLAGIPGFSMKVCSVIMPPTPSCSFHLRYRQDVYRGQAFVSNFGCQSTERIYGSYSVLIVLVCIQNYKNKQNNLC